MELVTKGGSLFKTEERDGMMVSAPSRKKLNTWEVEARLIPDEEFVEKDAERPPVAFEADETAGSILRLEQLRECARAVRNRGAGDTRARVAVQGETGPRG